MFETKYIPSENAEKIIELLNKCKEEYPEMIFYIYDTESFVCKSQNPDKILEEIDGGDEEIGINCWVNGENSWVNGEMIGWFGCFPYEEPDSIFFDCSDNNFCNKIYREITE